jgi:hypothetical protein
MGDACGTRSNTRHAHIMLSRRCVFGGGVLVDGEVVSSLDREKVKCGLWADFSRLKNSLADPYVHVM